MQILTNWLSRFTLGVVPWPPCSFSVSRHPNPPPRPSPTGESAQITCLNGTRHSAWRISWCVFLASLAAVICSVGFPTITLAANVGLSWSAATESDLAGYKVYYGTASRSYGTPINVGKVTTYTLTGLSGGKYYFAVTAYDTSNNESSFSSEMSLTIASDATPPIISAVSSSAITSSGATIKWTTNEASNTQVDYGTTTSYGSSTPVASSLVTTHSVSLSGLQASKLYHYRVKSKDASGNLATSGDFTFTTSATSDTSVPMISSLGASSITSSGATIGWTTNEASDTQVDYGTTTSYGSSTALLTSMATSHSVSLSGLNAGTLYHYRLKSRDQAGNLATSADFTFTTTTSGDASPPVISRQGVSWITASTATINWTTNESSDTQVDFGTTTAYGSSTTLVSTLVIGHGVRISGLKASTLYHYRVKSRDQAKNLATSADSTFTTSVADTAPPLISGIAVTDITSSGAVINWKTNEASDSFVNYGLSTSYVSSTPADLSLTTSHAQRVSGLSAGKLYYFRVRSRDATGNTGWSGDLSFKTLTAGGTSPTIITFTNPTPSGTPNSILKGIFQGINFGSSGWAWESSYGPDATPHIYFDSGTVSSRTFTFSPAPKILNSICVFSMSSGTMTLSDNLGQSKSQTISTGSVQLVATGWAKGSTTVKVYFTRGWNLGVDDIRYSSVTTTSPQMLSAEPSSLFFASLKRRTIEENSRSTISTTGPTGSDQPETSAQDPPRKVLLASVIESPRLRTNLGINSLSNSLATVKISLFDKNGSPLGAKTLQVSPLGSQQVNHVVQFLYPGFTGELDGTLYLESDQPICAWSSQIANQTEDPSFSFGRPSGSTKILIGSAAELSPSESSLSVLNAGSAVAQVSITAYDVSGLAIGQTETAIPLLPKATLELNNVLSALGVKDPVGPLEITSLNDVPLLAVSRVSTPEHFGGTLEGLSPSNASTALVVPVVADNAGVGTSLDIKNVTDRAAQVIIRFRVQDGSELGFLQVTVPPKGFTALVDVVRQLVQAPGASGLEGSVELESDEPILAWASQIDHLTQDPAFIQGRKQGSNKLLVPSAINVGTFRSSLTVTNTGNGTAFVDVLCRGADGEIQGQLRNIFIPAKGYFSWVDILESLGIAQGFGSIEIISTNGQPLVGTSRIRSISGASGFLDAVPVD